MKQAARGGRAKDCAEGDIEDDGDGNEERSSGDEDSSSIGEGVLAHLKVSQNRLSRSALYILWPIGPISQVSPSPYHDFCGNVCDIDSYQEIGLSYSSPSPTLWF